MKRDASSGPGTPNYYESEDVRPSVVVERDRMREVLYGERRDEGMENPNPQDPQPVPESEGQDESDSTPKPRQRA